VSRNYSPAENLTFSIFGAAVYGGRFSERLPVHDAAPKEKGAAVSGLRRLQLVLEA
jgi:hypothetical protein